LDWPGGRELVEFPMGNSAHNYKFQVDTPGLPNPVWYCYLDSVPKWNKTVNYMDFESGSSLVAQGETDSRWSQIGRVYPNKLLYSNMQYRNEAGSWPIFDANSFNTINQTYYGRDEPAAGRLRNWSWPDE
jgi:hypothetical protein